MSRSTAVTTTTRNGNRAIGAAPSYVPAPAAPEASFGELLQMGQQLVGTGFLPDHIKNGAQAAAIILAGRELGMQPMRALRSLVLVKGKVTEYADSQLSRFKADGGHAKFLHLDETKAVLHLRHPNGDEHTETFTIDDAKRAGLLSNQNYQKFTKAMLRSRAITAGLKSVGWEGGAGVYDPAELEPVTYQEPAEAAQEVQHEETGEVPSDKQVALLDKLLKSHVFSDEERENAREYATTKARMTKVIDRVQQQITERKAAEKAERKQLEAEAAAELDANRDADEAEFMEQINS